jgi:hypothetical protein
MKSILALVVLALSATGVAAAETPHLAFVTEYARELGVNEHLRELGEKDIGEQGADKNAAMIRSSTRIVLELTSQVAIWMA